MTNSMSPKIKNCPPGESRHCTRPAGIVKPVEQTDGTRGAGGGHRHGGSMQRTKDNSAPSAQSAAAGDTDLAAAAGTRTPYAYPLVTMEVHSSFVDERRCSARNFESTHGAGLSGCVNTRTRCSSGRHRAQCRHPLHQAWFDVAKEPWIVSVPIWVTGTSCSRCSTVGPTPRVHGAW